MTGPSDPSRPDHRLPRDHVYGRITGQPTAGQNTYTWVQVFPVLNDDRVWTSGTWTETDGPPQFLGSITVPPPPPPPGPPPPPVVRRAAHELGGSTSVPTDGTVVRRMYEVAGNWAFLYGGGSGGETTAWAYVIGPRVEGGFYPAFRHEGWDLLGGEPVDRMTEKIWFEPRHGELGAIPGLYPCRPRYALGYLGEWTDGTETEEVESPVYIGPSFGEAIVPGRATGFTGTPVCTDGELTSFTGSSFTYDPDITFRAVGLAVVDEGDFDPDEFDF